MDQQIENSIFYHKESSSMTSSMKVGELAAETGKTRRTIRFYEEKGLLKPVRRTAGGYRMYGKDALIRIHWIDRLQQLGFSLNDISVFLQSLQGQPYSPGLMKEIHPFYEQKLKETQEHIQRLEGLKAELEDAMRYLDNCQSCNQKANQSCLRCTSQSEDMPTMISAISGKN
jgi:DNA-binding transcriptional MerR regulator